MRPTRREFLRHLGLGAGRRPAGGLLASRCRDSPTAAPAKPAGRRHHAAPAAAGSRRAPARVNGTKLTIWGWQSFTPEGDKALGDQMKEWGAANKTDVEYVVVENAQFPQKLAAAIEAKAPPDVVMLTSGASVLDYAGKDLLVDVTDVWNDTSQTGRRLLEIRRAAVQERQLLLRHAVRGRYLAGVRATGPDREGDRQARAAQDLRRDDRDVAQDQHPAERLRHRPHAWPDSGRRRQRHRHHLERGRHARRQRRQGRAQFARDRLRHEASSRAGGTRS